MPLIVTGVGNQIVILMLRFAVHCLSPPPG